jgi:hypothetical protein
MQSLEMVTYTHPSLKAERIREEFDKEFQDMVYEIEENFCDENFKRVVVRLLQERHRPNLSRFDATGKATLSWKGLRVKLLPKKGLNPWAKPFYPRNAP